MYSINRKVLPGDIILIDSNSTNAKFIKKATNSDFSHAALVISQTQAIEALGESGVQITSLLRFIVDEISNISIKRMKDLNTEKVTELMELAIKEQSKGYDLKGAINSILPLKSKTKDDQFFCSQLVAELYKKIGIELFNKDSSLVVPEDFNNIDLVEDVTEEVVTKLPQETIQRFEKNPELCRPIDNGFTSKSPDAERHRKFLKDVQALFKKKKLSYPKQISDIVEIITRPDSIDGNIYLDKYVNKQLEKLYKKHKILEELNKELEKNDSLLTDMKEEVEKYGIEHAIKELYTLKGMYEYREKQLQDKQGFVNELNNLNNRIPGIKFIELQLEYYNLVIYSITNLLNEINLSLEYLEDYIQNNT
jgi:hypothetical protein